MASIVGSFEFKHNKVGVCVYSEKVYPPGTFFPLPKLL